MQATPSCVQDAVNPMGFPLSFWMRLRWLQVMNGAMLYWPMPNVLYVEGHGLDQFAAGDWGLRPVHQNKAGHLGIQSPCTLSHGNANPAGDQFKLDRCCIPCKQESFHMPVALAP